MVTDFTKWSKLYTLSIEQDLYKILPDIRSCLDMKLMLIIIDQLNYQWEQFNTLLQYVKDLEISNEQSAQLDQIFLLKLGSTVIAEEEKLFVTKIGIQYYEWRHHSIQTEMPEEFFEYGKKFLAALAELDPYDTRIKELQIDHCDSDTREMIKMLTVQMMKIINESIDMKKEIDVLRESKEEYELDRKHYMSEISKLQEECAALANENKRLTGELTEVVDYVHTSKLTKYKSRIKRIINREEDD